MFSLNYSNQETDSKPHAHDVNETEQQRDPSGIIKQCQGGRYREIDDKIIIQCDCQFKCTSRNTVIYKKSGYHYPYYYIPNDCQGGEWYRVSETKVAVRCNCDFECYNKNRKCTLIEDMPKYYIPNTIRHSRSYINDALQKAEIPDEFKARINDIVSLYEREDEYEIYQNIEELKKMLEPIDKNYDCHRLLYAINAI